MRHNLHFSDELISMGYRFSRALGTLAGSIALSLATANAPAAEPVQPPPQWVAAWATALQSIPELHDPPPLYRAPEVGDRTVREIIYPTLSGERIRLRVSNAYGRAPLVLTDVRIARSAAAAATRPPASAPITFGGRASIDLLPGQELESDAIPFKLDAGVAYAVSAHAAPGQVLGAWHRVANQVNYVSVPGDHAGDPSTNAYGTRFTEHAWVTGISVETAAASAIAAIGDSITDGMRSTLDQNRRWPDAFARRLMEAGQHTTAVLNLGISGNRLLSDSPCYGEALERRFARDVLARPGVKAAVVLIGINDINFAAMPPRRGLDCDAPHTQVAAGDLIEGYRRLIEASHARGVRIFGTTLTPASLPVGREAIRQSVNAWIRSSGAFDGVIDFDAALRDPVHRERLRAEYDSGDHIHPSDAGYAAMAHAVPLDAVVSAARGR
jgi:lysophospholipase L1-like esterase